MWEYEIANIIKKSTYEAKGKAISSSTLQIGTIEQICPLVISAFGGEAMYEENEMQFTKTFKSYMCTKVCKTTGKHNAKFSAGDKVLIGPIGSYTKVIAIDLLGGA